MNDDAVRRTALVVAALSSFITPLLLSSVNVAVPAIARAFNADAVRVSWVNTGYLLAAAMFLLPFGKLADMVGRKRIFKLGFFIVVATGILAAFARGIDELIAIRIVQGIGAAMLFATSIALLSSVYPREGRGAAIGITVSAVYFGLTIGPAIGGWITDTLGWRAVFVYHVPISVAAIALTYWKLKQEWHGEPGQRFDYIGSVIYGLGIVAVVYGASILPAASGYAFIAAGIAGLGLFLRYESRCPHPVFDVSLLFSNRVFAFSCVASLLMYTATFANSFVMSLYLQHLKGMTAAAAGVVMMSQPVVQTVLSPLMGRLSDRIEARWLSSAGLLSAACGLFALGAIDAASPLAVVVAGLMTVGVGFALFTSPNLNAQLGAVDPRALGVAGGVTAAVRVIGQMFSMTMITLAIALHLGRAPIVPENYPALARSISLSFHIAATLCVIAIAFSLARGRTHGRPSTAP